MLRPVFAIVSIAITAYCTGVIAQNGPTIYRCGNQYSQQPCQDPRTDAKPATGSGNQETLHPQDPLPPSSSQGKKAKTYAEQADSLARERQRREAQEARNAQREPAQFKAPQAEGPTNPEAKRAKKSHSKKRKEPDYFTAGAPQSKPKP